MKIRLNTWTLWGISFWIFFTPASLTAQTGEPPALVDPPVFNCGLTLGLPSRLVLKHPMDIPIALEKAAQFQKEIQAYLQGHTRVFPPMLWQAYRRTDVNKEELAQLLGAAQDFERLLRFTKDFEGALLDETKKEMSVGSRLQKALEIFQWAENPWYPFYSSARIQSPLAFSLTESHAQSLISHKKPESLFEPWIKHHRVVMASLGLPYARSASYTQLVQRLFELYRLSQPD